MDLTMITADRDEALAKWHEYLEAYKVSKNPMHKELRNIYNQVKKGKKIIDISSVINLGGRRPREKHTNYWEPNFAITWAKAKKVYYEYWPDGSIKYSDDHSRSKQTTITIPKALPTYNWRDDASWRTMDGMAPVPLIPPGVWNKKVTDSMYILWEVDKWEMVPSKDPVLLQRISKTLFVYLASWELTELERLVMEEYIK